MTDLTSGSAKETQALGQALGRLSQPGDVFLLTGELGAGKTCLTQGIAWGLGIEGYATSPTFMVLNEYRGRLPLYHIDLYRIDSVTEIEELGLDDYLYGEGVSAVEWADKAPEALPAEHLLVRLTFIDDSSRRLALEPHGQRYAELLAQLEKER